MNSERKKDGATRLFIAAQQGHKDVVQVLLDTNVDVNKAQNDGVIALFIAAEQVHKDVVQVLRDTNADVNETWNDGATTPFVTPQPTLTKRRTIQSLRAPQFICRAACGAGDRLHIVLPTRRQPVFWGPWAIALSL